MRSFIAVLLPEPVRARVYEAAADLRRAEVAASWVRPENLHLTLRFLGAVAEGTLGRVREGLEEAVAAIRPFTVTLGAFGGFPSTGMPRVVWIGVDTGGDSLAAVHGAIEAALARRGIPREQRAFRGHVTLGRLRDLRGAPTVGRVLEGCGTLGDEVPVDAVVLMRSDLLPTGARYSVLARVPLGSAAR